MAIGYYALSYQNYEQNNLPLKYTTRKAQNILCERVIFLSTWSTFTNIVSTIIIFITPLFPRINVLPQKQTLQNLSCFIKKMPLTFVCLYLAVITFNCAEVGLTVCSLNPKDTVNFQQYLQDLWKSALLFFAFLCQLCYYIPLFSVYAK